MYNDLLEGRIKSQSSDNLELLSIIKSFISLIKKRWKLYLWLILLGIAAGVVFFIVSKPVYKSQMSALSWSLDDNKVVGHLEDVEKLIQYKDYEQLAVKLQLKPETVKEIVSVKTKREKPEGEVVYEDTERKFGFTVTAEVYNADVLDSLEKGIKYYIESTEFVETRLSAYKTQLAYNIAKTTREIDDLTILKNNLNNLLAVKSSEGSNIFLSDVGRTSTNIVELHEKLVKLQEDMQLASDFIVIKRFTKYKKRSSPRLLYCVLGGSFIGLLFCLIAAFYQPAIKFIKEA